MLTVRIIRKDGSEDRRNYQGNLKSCEIPVNTLLHTHLTQDPECRIVAFDDQLPQNGETVLHDGLPKADAAREPAPVETPLAPVEGKPAPVAHKKTKGK